MRNFFRTCTLANSATIAGWQLVKVVPGISEKSLNSSMYVSATKLSCDSEMSKFDLQANNCERRKNITNAGVTRIDSVRHNLTDELIAMNTLDPDAINDEKRSDSNCDCRLPAILNHATILPLIRFTSFDEPDGPSIVMLFMKASVQHSADLLILVVQSLSDHYNYSSSPISI
jgi:hypothetical protein